MGDLRSVWARSPVGTCHLGVVQRHRCGLCFGNACLSRLCLRFLRLAACGAAWFSRTRSMQAETADGSRARLHFPFLSPSRHRTLFPHLSSCCRGSNGPLRHCLLTLWGLRPLDWMRALAHVLRKAQTHTRTRNMRVLLGGPGRRGGLSFQSLPSPSLGRRPSAVML